MLKKSRDKNSGGLFSFRRPSFVIAATIIIFCYMIGSITVIAQEGQLIKEIKINITGQAKDRDISYKFPEPILLFPGNVINLHCFVKPTQNYSIKRADLTITRQEDGTPIRSWVLPITKNNLGQDEINHPIQWPLTGDITEADIYLAEIDLITTNATTPDAGAYVSMNITYSGAPVIIKFEDINGNEEYDEGIDRLLEGWQFTITDQRRQL